MAIAADTAPDALREERLNRRLARIARMEGTLNVLALGFVPPLLRAAAGDAPAANLRQAGRIVGIPLVSILLFLLVWAWLAPQVQTSLGAIPGPVQVWDQAVALDKDAAREAAKRDAFYERQEERNAQLVDQGKEDRVKWRDYTGKPTYYGQIWTSIKTVMFGFLIATVVAVPLGIASGLSPAVNAGLNPIVQIFKPVSPLAWLPIVTMVVSALYVSDNPMFSKSFLVSAITVTLCSLWPTLINTAHGVASIDKDLVNVSKVLKLSAWTKITKLVLPSALPLIFTGLRLSLGVGWMVLIAAEMLAQNPGLGKFVWDEFQNGSSQSLAKIIVAVLTIGIIGFILDRIMFAIQSAVSHNARS
ncbi:ABC transporter permease [Rhodobacteraceae bacterium DSL-40]|uniref:ABC transporter permease n=1 Tax=Amaricoccus sp. B4 TaxID=3368557 RepID=UPI000DACEECB